MRKTGKMLVLAVFALLAFEAVLAAQDQAKAGELQGVLVALKPQAFGDLEYTAMVVRPFDSDEHVTVLLPREPKEIGDAVRRLEEGQRVKMSYVTEEGHRWVTALQAGGLIVRLGGGEERVEIEEHSDEPRRHVEVRERRTVEQRRTPAPRERAGREPMRSLAGRLERLAGEFHRLAEQMRRMEGELRRLRAENEHLRRELRERGNRHEGRTHRDSERRTEGRERERRDARRGRQEREIRVMVDRRDRAQARPALPEGMVGFRGVLIGTIQRKLDRGFVLKVEKVSEVWEDNRADNPEAAVGRNLMIAIRDDDAGQQFLRTLRGLEVGEQVLAEAFHFGGNQLTVVEQLRALE